jgi:hypothetical protein
MLAKPVGVEFVILSKIKPVRPTLPRETTTHPDALDAAHLPQPFHHITGDDRVNFVGYNSYLFLPPTPPFCTRPSK